MIDVSNVEQTSVTETSGEQLRKTETGVEPVFAPSAESYKGWHSVCSGLGLLGVVWI